MDVFAQFKRNKNVTTHPVNTKAEDIYFLLQWDEDHSAYISTVNKQGKEIEEFDYTLYEGAQRNILKTIFLLQSNAGFTIDWNNPENKIYLHEHSYLLPQLLASKQFIDEKGKTIAAHAGPPQQLIIQLNGIEDGKRVQAVPFILLDNEHQFKFTYINENHAYLPKQGIVVETQNIGAYFHYLSSFSTTFPIQEMQKFLSLLLSYISNVSVNLEGYKMQYDEETIAPVPSLLFEKVDADNSLYLRVSATLPDSPVDFLDDYDLQRLVQINELEKIIHVKIIEPGQRDAHITEVEKTLKKIASQKGKKEAAELVRDENLFIIPEDTAANFVYKELPNFLGRYVIAGTEKLKQYKLNTHPPKLNLQLSHSIEFLEGDATLQFGNEQLCLFDAINQYNKNRYIILSDGSHAFVNDAYMQKLQRIFKKKNEKVKLSFFDLPLVEELLEEKAASQQFALSREIFEGFNQLVKRKVKLPALTATLRPYQLQGYQWLSYLKEKALGGCLADDMGLGKTLQTIALLAKVYEKKNLPSLVVMPKSLLFNWEQEVQRFASQLTFYTYYGSNRNWEDASRCNLIFTTYAMLRNDIEQFKEQSFCYVVLDESQNIKNINSQISRAVLLLQSEYRLALSGTPVENNLSELYALFRFLNPAMFESAENFNQHYLTPIQKYNDAGAAHDLRRKIYPFILRRLKKDVLTELPDKTEQVLYTEMSEEQARYYEERRWFYKDAIAQQVAVKGVQHSQFFVFQALNELRQIACIPEAKTGGAIESPKIEMLMEQLADAVANDHKVLVFANFLNAIELIGEQLNEQGIDYVSMTGSTRDRQALVTRFQNDANCKVFLMTLKTGGTGLNLTAADMVFIFDPWWNKAAENQAIDRTHRIGQHKNVTCYKLITKGTIEEKILQLQQLKAELFNNIIAGDAASLKSFSEEDIDYLMGGK